MSAKACRRCRFIVEDGEICSACESPSLSEEWFGYLIVLDSEGSEIARRLNITKPGRYALRVR